MKKFVNTPENSVEEMLQGVAILRPDLRRLSGYKVLLRSDSDQSRNTQVAIISGGGSGHEPAHIGYIGNGMLSAGVIGDVFTSPDTDSIFAAIKAVSGPRGVLLVVKNYTGDRLNFGLAAEMARSEGIPVEMIVVTDDVALDGATSFAGARGLAGTIFVHKLVGAAAAEGRPLMDIANIGRAAINSVATMGVSLSAGTSPLVGKPSFTLADDEMELGLGIHGEPGVQRTQIQTADRVTDTLLESILSHGRFATRRRLAVMINNLGATTEMELAIVARRTFSFLQSKGYIVERIFAGTFLSSLDMAGLSISVLAVDDLWLKWLDSTTNAPAWQNQPIARVQSQDPLVSDLGIDTSVARGGGSHTGLGSNVKHAIEAACNALIDGECTLTEMDRIVGDGDLGASMKRASLAVKEVLETYPLDDVPSTFKALSRTLRHELGGSSGPLYGVFFLRLGNALEASGWSDLDRWVDGIRSANSAITELGGAKPGDRSMLDALDAFVRDLENSSGGKTQERLSAAAEAAKRGAATTAAMAPRLGRSSYLRDRVLGHSDPGAEAVALWLKAVVASLQ